jgi:hypothetical protein
LFCRCGAFLLLRHRCLIRLLALLYKGQHTVAMRWLYHHGPGRGPGADLGAAMRLFLLLFLLLSQQYELPPPPL